MDKVIKFTKKCPGIFSYYKYIILTFVTFRFDHAFFTRRLVDLTRFYSRLIETHLGREEETAEFVEPSLNEDPSKTRSRNWMSMIANWPAMHPIVNYPCHCFTKMNQQC